MKKIIVTKEQEQFKSSDLNELTLQISKTSFIDDKNTERVIIYDSQNKPIGYIDAHVDLKLDYIKNECFFKIRMLNDTKDIPFIGEESWGETFYYDCTMYKTGLQEGDGTTFFCIIPLMLKPLSNTERGLCIGGIRTSRRVKNNILESTNMLYKLVSPEQMAKEIPFHHLMKYAKTADEIKRFCSTRFEYEKAFAIRPYADRNLIVKFTPLYIADVLIGAKREVTLTEEIEYLSPDQFFELKEKR